MALFLRYVYLYFCIPGWAPKAFVSSRSQRADVAGLQKPEDYMDEEVFLLFCIHFTICDNFSEQNNVTTSSIVIVYSLIV